MANVLNIQKDQPVLIVHAHPDDESVATGAVIETLTRDGIIVHVITATDGELSTRGDPQFVANRQRRGEAQTAYELLGVPPEQQHYLGLPDGELSKSKDQLAQLLQEFVTTHNTRVVITPGAEGFDGHPDHIAVHEAAVQCRANLRTMGKHLTIWALDAHGQGAVTVPVDSSRKLAAVAAHYSQFPMAKTARGKLTIPPDTQEYLRHYTDLLHKAETYSQAA